MQIVIDGATARGLPSQYIAELDELRKGSLR
jgi:hypothetical protein